MKKHVPVMINEVLQYFDAQNEKKYIDATVGEGGYTKEILKKAGVNGKMLCIDWNITSLKKAKSNLKKYLNQCVFICDNYANINEIADKNSFKNVDGIVYDLGLASWQIKDSMLGISFMKDEPLDMFLPTTKYKRKITAKEIVNNYSVKEIANILYKFGDVRNSWAIAKRLGIERRNRKIDSTFDFIKALNTKNPKILAPIFQALRIYVNKELESLETSLKQAINLLNKNARLVVLSYHSGEDRIVKNIFKQRYKEQKDIKILTKKPIIPFKKEILTNPSSRSAKLRAIEKIC